MEQTEKFSEMQQIKRRFFAMRNGVVADTLRRGGSSFRIIFGLNLPQLRDIAAEIGADRHLADLLWQNTSTRESLLLALLLIDPARLTRGEVERMAADITDREVADMFCHCIAGRRLDSEEIMRELLDEDSPMARYMGLRLLYGQTAARPDYALEIARREIARREAVTQSLALLVEDEASFWLEERENS